MIIYHIKYIGHTKSAILILTRILQLAKNGLEFYLLPKSCVCVYRQTEPIDFEHYLNLRPQKSIDVLESIRS